MKCMETNVLVVMKQSSVKTRRAWGGRQQSLGIITGEWRRNELNPDLPFSKQREWKSHQTNVSIKIRKEPGLLQPAGKVGVSKHHD